MKKITKSLLAILLVICSLGVIPTKAQAEEASTYALVRPFVSEEINHTVEMTEAKYGTAGYVNFFVTVEGNVTKSQVTGNASSCSDFKTYVEFNTGSSFTCSQKSSSVYNYTIDNTNHVITAYYTIILRIYDYNGNDTGKTETVQGSARITNW